MIRILTGRQIKEGLLIWVCPYIKGKQYYTLTESVLEFDGIQPQKLWCNILKLCSLTTLCAKYITGASKSSLDCDTTILEIAMLPLFC